MGFVRGVLSGKNPAQAVLLTLGTQMFIMSVLIASGMITARLLTPSALGIFGAVTLWPSLLAGMSLLGIPSSIVYHTRSDPDNRDAIVTSALILTTIIGVIATGIGFFIVDHTMASNAEYNDANINLGLFCAAWTAPYLVEWVLRQTMTAYGRYRTFNIAAYLPSVLFLVILIPVYFVADKITPAIAALCHLIPTALVLVWLTIDLCRVWRPRVVGLWAATRSLVSYAAKAAPADLSGAIFGSLDRFALVAMLAPDILGLYGVAYGLSRTLMMMQTIAQCVLFPQMAGNPHNAKYLHDVAFRLVLHVSVVMIILAMLFGRSFLAYAYHPAYGDAQPTLVILVAEAGLLCLATVTMQLFLAMNHPAWVSRAQTVSVGVAIGSILVYVPAWGAFGAALSLLTAGIVRLLLLTPRISKLNLRLPRLLLSMDDFRFIRDKLASVSRATQ